MCFTVLGFFPTTRGKEYGVTCALNQSQANIIQKLSRSFQKSFIRENEIGPTQLTSTPPTAIINIFFTSYSLVRFKNRQGFLVKLANEHSYLRYSLLSLLYCHGACGRSFHLLELQFPLLWKEQIPSILFTCETGEEINKVRDKMLLR